MDRRIFFQAFDNLVRRWFVYQDAPREPSRVVELAAARVRLDQARSEAAAARGAWAATHSEQRIPKRTSVSDDDLARLRVQIFPEG